MKSPHKKRRFCGNLRGVRQLTFYPAFDRFAWLPRLTVKRLSVCCYSSGLLFA
jgi:hypothetical protein